MSSPFTPDHGPVFGASSSDCSDFLESIIYLLDNELSEADVRAVRAHLDACSPCLESYDVQRTVKAVVARSCIESAPDALRQRVMFSIQTVQTVHMQVTDPDVPTRRFP